MLNVLQTADASQPKAIRMAGSSESESGPEALDEPFFSVLDIVLVVSLFLAAAWWLLKRRKEEEAPSSKSYSIQ